MNRLRIAHAVHGYPPEVIGGTELYVARLAGEQARRGSEVKVFAGSLEWRQRLEIDDAVADGVAVRRIHREDLYFDRWDKGFHPGVSKAFRAWLADWKPDVLHVHHWIRLSSDLIAQAARVGVPAVVTLHDLYPSCPRVFRLKGKDGDEACEVPLGKADCVPCVPRWRFDKDDEVSRRIAVYRADMRSELSLARVRIAPSASHAAFLKQMLETDVAIDVVPHGRLGEPLPPAATPPADGILRLACFSHLQPLKGQHVLLDAVKLCAGRDRIEVHLLGAAVDEAYEKRLKELASGLRVIFHGRYRRADLGRIGFDAVVLPTLCRESWSFTLDEAADLGVPILAADAGAMGERATGRVVLFRRNDAADLAARIDGLAGDRSRLTAMRAAPPPPVSELDRHVDAIEERYAAARLQGAPAFATAVDAATESRLADEWQRREVCFQELVRTEKWEDVVAELRDRIAQLERIRTPEAR